MAARILVVEDDPATRAGIVELLNRAGYEASACGRFEEARRALRESRPDLLITDIRLGDYNGLQLLVGTPEPVPTIIVTGFSDPVLEAEALAHNAPYLVKPILPAQLIATIERMLAGAGQDAPGVRRWTRKRPGRTLPVEVDGFSARIIDVSYGGLRLEVDRDPQEIPDSFTVRLPQLLVPVDVVWRSRTEADTMICGLALANLAQANASSWCGFVDAID
ncbi:MAG: response regulator [Betaproteobacteria bacterium]